MPSTMAYRQGDIVRSLRRFFSRVRMDSLAGPPIWRCLCTTDGVPKSPQPEIRFASTALAPHCGTAVGKGRPEQLRCPNPNVPARTRTWGLLLRRQSLYPSELRGLLELTGIRRPMYVVYVCQLEAERPPRYSSMAFLSRSSSGLW